MTVATGIPLNLSPIALQVPGVRDPSLGRRRAPWGFLLHTTGGGITDIAKRKHEKPIDVAIQTYINSQNGSNGYFWGGPSYVIDHDGSVHQIAPDDILTAHAGSSNRPRYFDGEWETSCSAETVARWNAAWGPRHCHPYELFPDTSPNVSYIGCEMIPIGDGFGGDPMASGLRFTKAQHEAALGLAIDVGNRHGFPDGWRSSSRLLGHEDVDPLARSDAGGGWDPGVIRINPYFDLSFVRA